MSDFREETMGVGDIMNFLHLVLYQYNLHFVEMTLLYSHSEILYMIVDYMCNKYQTAWPVSLQTA